jgi:uncharacterized protein (DUF1697 family)
MAVFIALLRAVNVGGTGTLPMAGLRAMAADLGLGSPRTLLQSGNLVFEANSEDAQALEALLERETEARLGVRTEYLLRSPEAWRHLVAANPFPAEADSDPARLLVFFMKAAPDPGPVEAAAEGLPETVRVLGREAYIFYPDGMGRSKLKLPVRGTGRNWNTVLRLAAMAGV